MPRSTPASRAPGATGTGSRRAAQVPAARRASSLLAAALIAVAAGCGDPTPTPPGPATTGTDGAGPGPAPASSPALTGNAGHKRMLAILDDIRIRTPEEHEFQGDARARFLQRELAALPTKATPMQRWEIVSELGDRLVYFGKEEEGLRYIQEAVDQLPSLVDQLPPDRRLEFLYRAATCWLRFGETQNCCALHGPESCILPLRGAAIHARPDGSRNAVRLLDQVLSEAAPNTPMYLQAQWLRSMAAMTLGEYPDGVPEAVRIPHAFFESEEPFPRFANVAGKLGLDYPNLAGSVVAEDFDDDGFTDLFVSSWDTAGQLRYFRNRGDGTLEDRTKAAGLEGLYGGLNMMQADYDGDGRMDLLVLRGAWLSDKGRHPNSLLHNNGDGTFTDRAFEAGIAGEGKDFPTMTACWLDYDNDGNLDLFVGNETSETIEAPCQLFRNNGDGTFTERAREAGVTNDRFTKGCAAWDYDGDRFPDIYVSNMGGENRLYRNLRNGKFEDVALAAGVRGPLRSFPCWFWDYDNDGGVDLFVAPFPATPVHLASAALGRNPGMIGALFHGDGKGGFSDRAVEAGLTKPYSTMGANFGDLDNDGFPEIYLGTGRPPARDLAPNMLFRNREGKGFADVTLNSGLGHLQKGHGIAFMDLDQDGDLDVFAQMGGAFAADMFHNACFENPGFGNRSVAVRLRGKESNRGGVGARIRASITEGGKSRSVHAFVNGGGSFGGNSLRQHMGIGRATKVDSLEVYWPVTGKTQVFKDIPADSLVDVVEGEDKPRVRPYKPQVIGGRK